MRRLSFDQFEFDSPCSEQSIEIAVATPSQYLYLESFLADCGASDSTGPPITPSWMKWNVTADDFHRRAGIELPHPSQWRESALIDDEWNDLEIAVAAESILIWYHWYTTA
jgi:hypothetical protein